MKDIRIAVLQRGWVLVGPYRRDGDSCFIEGGYVVSRWGTTEGLGEIALNGPTTETVLHPAPLQEWHRLTEVFTMTCDYEVWRRALIDAKYVINKQRKEKRR